MADICISKKAARHYYGGECLVIMCSSLLSAGAQYVHDSGFQLLVLSRDGLVHTTGESPDAAKQGHKPLGVGCGLRAFITTGISSRSATDWQSFIGECAPHREIEFGIIDTVPWRRAHKVKEVIHRLLKAEVASLSDMVAVSRQETRVLRTVNEDLHLANTRMSRVLEAFGADRQYLRLELEPSSNFVGPESGTAEYHVKQRLPLDVSTISSISLFVKLPEREPIDVDGQLSVSLSQAANGESLVSVDRPYSALNDGWNRFELQHGASLSGDAHLSVKWRAAGAHPLVALSGVTNATDQEASLAVRVYTGYSELDADVRDSGAFASNYAITPLSMAFLNRSLIEVGQEKTRKNLTFDDAGSWFQTHADSHEIVAVKHENIETKNLHALNVSTVVAHENGPTVRFWAILTDGTPSDCDITNAITNGAVEPIALAFSASEVTPENSSSLVIVLPERANAHNVSLYCCVETLSETSDFGWCRWSDLSLLYVSQAADLDLEASPPPKVSPMRDVRSHRFPELFSQIDYIEGKIGAQKVFDQVGYSPMIVSEENGSLQTHPIKDGVSAAICRHMVFSNTVSVSADIETAHPDAPDFIYILVAIKMGQANLTQLMTAIADVARAEVRANSVWHDGALFSSIRVAAGVKTSLTIEFAEADHIADLRDVVCAVVPVTDDTGFGWCRWNRLNIERLMDGYTDG